MKPSPTTEQPIASAHVEFTVQFSRGPKGRRRVGIEPTHPGVCDTIPPEPVPSRSVVPATIQARTQVPPATPPAIPTPVASSLIEVAPPAREPDTALSPPLPKLTLLLVLGHHFELLVRDGTVKDYAEIARRTGLTRARVTQLCNLTLLAPEIQEVILDQKLIAEGVDPVHERALRRVVAEPDWRRQRRLPSTQ